MNLLLQKVINFNNLIQTFFTTQFKNKIIFYNNKSCYRTMIERS
jgi:hypothetical protein